MKLKLICGLSAFALVGCIDNAYDLSDIDTTTEVKVDDLVLPVNVDKVTLSDILDLSETSKVKVVTVDGVEYYAVVETGTFNPGSVEVARFTAAAPVIEDTRETISGVPAVAYISFPINKDEKTFAYNFSGIPDAVYGVKSVGVEGTTMSITIDMSSIAASTSSLSLDHLTLELPKGLTAVTSRGTYDASTGILSLGDVQLDNGKADVTLTISAIDFEANGAVLDYNAHKLSMSCNIGVQSGEIHAVKKSDVSEIGNASLVIKYNMSPITAVSFTGKVKYDIDGMSISPIELSDLPDVLTQDGTSLALANPQIYLSINNMVAKYGLTFSASLKMTANREGKPSLSYTTDDGASVNVGTSNGSGPYNFVLSPSMPSSPLPEFSKGLSHVPFTSLSDVFAGNGTISGIPTSISVEVVNPQIPLQDVTDFKLGSTLTSDADTYEFYAPLALKKNSLIVYTKTFDGWNDEDVDKITISSLTVSATATSTLPVGATIVGYPIDKDGNVINNVKTDGGVIQANANGQEITITTTGTITHLDGVKIEARVQSEDDKALSPSQTIQFENIRVKVSGSYTREL